MSEPTAPGQPAPEALHHEVRDERNRIWAIFEKRIRTLVQNHWPYVEATESIAVLEWVAERIDPTWRAKIVTIVQEEVAELHKPAEQRKGPASG